MKTLLCASSCDTYCKGHTKYKNKSGVSPLTENTDKIALLLGETNRRKATFVRVNFSSADR